MEPPSPSFAPWARGVLATAAAALADRLRTGAVPKNERAAARLALKRAYEVLEADTDSEAPPALPVDVLALVRDVDTRATPPLRWPGGTPRIGIPLLKGAIDTALVDRIWAYGDSAARISERIDAFLEATGAEPLRLFVAEVRPGERESPEMAFTEG